MGERCSRLEERAGIVYVNDLDNGGEQEQGDDGEATEPAHGVNEEGEDEVSKANQATLKSKIFRVHIVPACIILLTE